MIHGIDVSPHQDRRGGPGIDWKAVYGAGIRFVYLRAFEGKDRDEHAGGYSFAAHRAAALDAGLMVGAYVYFRARHPGRWQADLLLDALGELEPGELPPALELETLDGQPAVEVQAAALGWIEVVQRAIGRPPVLYTYPSFWTHELRGATLADLAGCPLWIAHYDVPTPTIPKPWGRAQFWQHTGDGRVQGIAGAVDLNTFSGREEELRGWAVQPPAPAAPSLEQQAREAQALGVLTLDESIDNNIKETLPLGVGEERQPGGTCIGGSSGCSARVPARMYSM